MITSWPPNGVLVHMRSSVSHPKAFVNACDFTTAAALRWETGSERPCSAELRDLRRCHLHGWLGRGCAELSLSCTCQPHKSLIQTHCLFHLSLSADLRIQILRSACLLGLVFSLDIWVHLHSFSFSSTPPFFYMFPGVPF